MKTLQLGFTAQLSEALLHLLVSLVSQNITSTKGGRLAS